MTSKIPGDLGDVFRELGSEKSCPGSNLSWLLGKPLSLVRVASSSEVEINYRE